MEPRHVEDVLARLEHDAQAIRALVDGVGAEQARWRPTEEAWSIVEVVNHLADEEVEDFRARLDSTLHRPEDDYAPIDPQGWVTARDYAARDLAASLDRFLAERARSLAWLRGLEAPRWDTAHVHPVFGTMRAGDLLTAWAAHDALHLRQLAELQGAWIARIAAPFDPSYAGDW